MIKKRYGGQDGINSIPNHNQRENTTLSRGGKEVPTQSRARVQARGNTLEAKFLDPKA